MDTEATTSWSAALAGVQQHAAGTPVLFEVRDHTGRTLNTECNIYGVVRSIAQDLLDSVQFDGVNSNEWTFTVRMEPYVK